MKSISDSKTNFTVPTVIKIIKEKKSTEQYFFVGKIINQTNKNIVIISKNKISTRHNYIHGIVLDQININDIFIIYSTGKIIFLFESQNDDNTLFLTNNCNSRCVFCSQTQYNDVIDYFSSTDLIKNINKNTKVLGISGGEPTYDKDKFLNVISDCHKMLPNTTIEILSNGINFKDIEFVKELIFIGHMKMKFEIPLHGDTNALHNELAGTATFDHTIRGIYNLAKFEQNIEIRIVLNKLNFQRLPEIAHFIYKNFPFVNHIAFMGLELEGRSVKNIDTVWIDPISYMDELYQAIKYLNMVNMNVSIYNLQLCLLPKELWKFAAKSISSWKNIYLPECSDCRLKMLCGGFFVSSKVKKSNHIKPI